MTSDWKARLEAVWAAEERRKGQARKKLLSGAVLSLTAGDSVFFVPPKTTHARYGQRAKVVRGPRSDVQSPTVRVEFVDGETATVQARYLRRTPADPVDPAYLQEARRLPSWKRLVTQLATPQPDPQAAEQRARQMAGMVGRSASREERGQMARVLLEAAAAEAVYQQAKQPGRGGRGPVRHEPPKPATATTDPARLDQEQRAMINLIAKSIHRRYFLSDRQIEKGLTSPESGFTVLRRYDDPTQAVREEVLAVAPEEERAIQRDLRRIIGLGQQEAGSTEANNKRGSRGNELHGLIHDHLTAAYQKALEACQWLSAGRVDLAQTLAAQVQEHRLMVQAADAELEKSRVKHHTGRYFHGDILSVRKEHVLLGENGEFLGYEGMTQYYARVVFVYDEDGHTLIVANAPELESLTGLKVGPQGWASLCCWVQDMSERAGGRKQGRRQDDDERLIYRENEGALRLREGLQQYGDLLLALDCIRAALFKSPLEKDILGSDIPLNHPAEGHHLFAMVENAPSENRN